MLLQGARIYPFPPTRDVSQRLTVRDKLDLHARHERIQAAGFRCVLGRDRSGIDHDFVEFHRDGNGDGNGGAVWTLVRAGPRIRVWREANGPDLGVFPSLGEAVDAVLAATPARKPVSRTVSRTGSRTGH